MRSKFLSILIAVLTSLGLVALWPTSAIAQGPESIDFDLSIDDYESEFTLLTWAEFLAEWPPTYGGCTPIDPWTGDPSDLGTWRNGIGWSTITCGVQQYDSTPSFGPHYIIGLKTNFFIYSPDTTADFYITYRTPTGNSDLSESVFCYDNGTYESIAKIGQSGNEAHYEIEAGQSCQIVVAGRFVDFAGDPYSAVTRIRTDYYNSAQYCPTVQNAGFIAADSWLLNGTAAITHGVLTLGPDDIAAQNLTLASNTDYNAVISTTGTVSGSTSLSVVLGTGSETIEIDSAGVFTASFTTPTLGGPIAYGLENIGENSIDLDFTCVYLADDGGAVASNCLAPVNGTFDTADNWTYIRDATWYSPAKEAALPYADTALIVSTSLYSLPTLTTGEHLLLSFSSRKLDDTQTGGVMGRAKSGASSAAFTYEVFPTDYTFETNIDAVAGLDNVELAFVNPGLEGSPTFSGTSDIAIDNICVFTATRGANLPAPVDPNGITPVDLGFNWTSCSQTDGIMAGFGVNMAQYRADYTAGASVWDPIGWVPWLISALWMNLAAWLCVFMAAFVTLIDVLEYIINNILNIAGWIIRSWPAMVQWLGEWGEWLGNTLAALSNAYGNFLAAWADWIGTGLAYISGVIGLTLAAVAEWLGNSLANLSSWLGSTLAALWAWLSTYLLNLNGLRTIANWIIAAWNLYLSTLGAVLSALIQVAVDVWDSTLYPVLQAIWDYLAGFALVSLIAETAVGFVGAAFDLFWMVIQWIWANVVMMVNLPFQLYYGFNAGVQSEAFSALIACASENWFCSFLAGVQIINQTVGATILYPIVIAGIILATLGIFWKNIWKMFTIDIA